MKEPKVFLDMDGVVCDFNRAVRNWYGIPMDESIDTYAGVLDAAAKRGISEDVFWSGLGHNFWARVPKTYECDVILALVEPYNPIILTSPCSSPYGASAGGKQEWIAKNLPEYFTSKRYLIGPPKHYCASPGSVLVDDSDEQESAWKSEGGEVVLVPRPWNRLRGKPVLLSIQTQLMDILKDNY